MSVLLLSDFLYHIILYCRHKAPVVLLTNNKFQEIIRHKPFGSPQWVSGHPGIPGHDGMRFCVATSLSGGTKWTNQESRMGWEGQWLGHMYCVGRYGLTACLHVLVWRAAVCYEAAWRMAETTVPPFANLACKVTGIPSDLDILAHAVSAVAGWNVNQRICMLHFAVSHAHHIHVKCLLNVPCRSVCQS